MFQTLKCDRDAEAETVIIKTLISVDHMVTSTRPGRVRVHGGPGNHKSSSQSAVHKLNPVVSFVPV